MKRNEIRRRYSILPWKNEPQFIYGVPDDWDPEGEVFSAVHFNGLFGLNIYYSIEVRGGDYYFILKYTTRFPKKINEPKLLVEIEHGKEYYHEFIKIIKKIIKKMKIKETKKASEKINENIRWSISFNRDELYYDKGGYCGQLVTMIDDFFNAKHIINQKYREIFIDGNNEKDEEETIDSKKIEPSKKDLPEINNIQEIKKTLEEMDNFDPQENVTQFLYGVPDFINKDETPKEDNNEYAYLDELFGDENFKEYVKKNSGDPFWENATIEYFENEVKLNDDESLKIYKDLQQYSDILNEFLKCIAYKRYEQNNPILVEGYSAKKIFEMNSNLKAHEIYLLLKGLRDEPEKTKAIIDDWQNNK